MHCRHCEQKQGRQSAGPSSQKQTLALLQAYCVHTKYGVTSKQLHMGAATGLVSGWYCTNCDVQQCEREMCWLPLQPTTVLSWWCCQSAVLQGSASGYTHSAHSTQRSLCAPTGWPTTCMSSLDLVIKDFSQPCSSSNNKCWSSQCTLQ